MIVMITTWIMTFVEMLPINIVMVMIMTIIKIIVAPLNIRHIVAFEH